MKMGKAFAILYLVSAVGLNSCLMGNASFEDSKILPHPINKRDSVIVRMLLDTNNISNKGIADVAHFVYPEGDTGIELGRVIAIELKLLNIESILVLPEIAELDSLRWFAVTGCSRLVNIDIPDSIHLRQTNVLWDTVRGFRFRLSGNSLTSLPIGVFKMVPADSEKIIVSIYSNAISELPNGMESRQGFLWDLTWNRLCGISDSFLRAYYDGTVGFRLSGVDTLTTEQLRVRFLATQKCGSAQKMQ